MGPLKKGIWIMAGKQNGGIQAITPQIHCQHIIFDFQNGILCLKIAVFLSYNFSIGKKKKLIFKFASKVILNY